MNFNKHKIPLLKTTQPSLLTVWYDLLIHLWRFNLSDSYMSQLCIRVWKLMGVLFSNKDSLSCLPLSQAIPFRWKKKIKVIKTSLCVICLSVCIWSIHPCLHICRCICAYVHIGDWRPKCDVAYFPQELSNLFIGLGFLSAHLLWLFSQDWITKRFPVAVYWDLALGSPMPAWILLHSVDPKSSSYAYIAITFTIESSQHTITVLPLRTYRIQVMW